MSHTIVENVQRSIKIAAFATVAFAITAVSAHAMTPAEQMQSMQSQLRTASEKLAAMRPAGAVLGASSTTSVVVPVRPVCRMSVDKKSYKLGETINVTWKTTGTKTVEFVPADGSADSLSFPSATLTTNGSAKITASVLGLPTIAIKVTSATGHTMTCSKVVSIVDTTASAKDSRVSALNAQILKLGSMVNSLMEKRDAIQQKIDDAVVRTAELQAKINEILSNPNGSSTKASVSIPADGVETDTVIEGSNGNVGTFSIDYEVTAVDADIYMLTSAAKSGKAGANYRITTGSASSSVTGTQTAVLTSTADKDGSVYVVNEGETETFTLTVTFDPTVTGEYRLQLVNAQWATTPDATTFKKTSLDTADFRTDYIVVQGS